MLTRKHFRQVANYLKVLYCKGIDIIPIYQECYKKDFLKNPRFDEKRFLEACGIIS